MFRLAIACLLSCCVTTFALAESIREQILDDRPVAYFGFDSPQPGEGQSALDVRLDGRVQSDVELEVEGPRPPIYSRFDRANLGVRLNGQRGYIAYQDPGDQSPLDFANGDTITIEAWVNPESIANDQQIYIVGKGRTNNAGVARENQNYALRLRGLEGKAAVSFLFRRAGSEAAGRDGFHRWNSKLGFVPDGFWHHVAVVYTFGKPDSIRAYVDGQESDGTWDIGGPTAEPPVVDNDELWIGSSLGGNNASTFHGQIDEIAIYRSAVPAERLQDRYHVRMPDPREIEFAAAEKLNTREIAIELVEKTPGSSWPTVFPKPTEQYSQSYFAFVGFPKKYSSTGVITDRSNPIALRARAKHRVSEAASGQYRFLLRAKNAARLYLDGTLLMQTNFSKRNGSGHEEVPELAIANRAGVPPLPPSTQEMEVTVELTPGEHVFRLDLVVGGPGLRLELRDTIVYFARADEPYHVLAAQEVPRMSADVDSWAALRQQLAADLATMDARNREQRSAAWREFWRERHDLARRVLSDQDPVVIPDTGPDLSAFNAIDHFINEKLAANGLAPAPSIDDDAFLRRVMLDTIGVVPKLDDVARFYADRPDQRRTLLIERMLDHPDWADHWVSYWQDVLAENPGILKPKLNNTGPFRWWIYESFRDNKPMDQFVTELVLMEGSKYYGGPAGFAMASQNDVPLAAKAHVLSTAFLGVEMKCARCHDAPFHPFKQEELFRMAALLNRKPIKLPQTSTVPGLDSERDSLIQVTLTPGSQIEPQWPFHNLSDAEMLPELTRNQKDPRERLAALLTSPRNERFAQVMANRMWHRLLGYGLVHPVDDWYSADEPANPELLAYLGRQFVQSGYDWKALARMILQSHVYQRQITPAASEHPQWFVSPQRRRLSAEQLVDSLFAASGKEMGCEPLTLDPDGRRPVDSFLNLGVPRRAWQFTSLSNERDRPALALPMAQSVIDLLLTFGWRDARPNPLTVRDETPTVLQPLSLANGVIGRRAVTLSDDSRFTALSLKEQPLDQLVHDTFYSVLTRPPNVDEQEWVGDYLRDGFESRIVAGAKVVPPRPTMRTAVSWSNHLSAEATRLKLEMERAVQAGDQPTKRLQSGWRERMEDVLWALMNSPEFVFVP